MKRVFDVAAATVGLVVLAPVMALIALAIKLDSRGPVLFTQRRLGLGGRAFQFYKFRTMADGNDPSIHRQYVTKLIRNDDEGLLSESGAFKIERDPRVTRLGRILRRTSLDELPQLFNVLRGDMSLVGPRPPIDYEVALYSARDLRRLTVLPGLTGLWQVSGRTRTTFEEMIDLDLKYVEEWSFLLDLGIVVRTFRAVLSREGAW